jgi:hypothetical protein
MRNIAVLAALLLALPLAAQTPPPSQVTIPLDAYDTLRRTQEAPAATVIDTILLSGAMSSPSRPAIRPSRSPASCAGRRSSRRCAPACSTSCWSRIRSSAPTVQTPAKRISLGETGVTPQYSGALAAARSRESGRLEACSTTAWKGGPT